MPKQLPSNTTQKVLAILLLGFLASCGHFSNNSLPLPGNYHGNNQILPQNFNAVISWKRSKEEKPLQFLAFIEFGEKTTTLVALNASGMRMFTLIQNHSDNSLNVENSFFNDSDIQAEQLFKDLLLSYLSADYLQENLSSSWQLTATRKQRVLLYNNTPTKHVNYSDNLKQQASFTGLNQLGQTEYRFDINLQEGSFQ